MRRWVGRSWPLSPMVLLVLVQPPANGVDGAGGSYLLGVALVVAGTALFVALLVVMLNSGLQALVRRHSRALSESEERFRTMADSVPFLIWLSGLDKGCSWFNAGWLRFTGRPMELELGNGWAEGVHPEDFAACLQIYQQHFDARQSFQMEYRLRRYDGEYRWILDAGAPRFLDDGTFAGFSGACLDITDRKRAEAELLSSRTELAHSNESLQQFAYAASHDLQEPLRMISSYLQLIDRRYGTMLDDQGKEFLFFAVDGAHRMQALIHELLDFSRLGTRAMEMMTLDLGDCWDAALQNLQVVCRETGAEIKADPLPHIHGCPVHLTRLLQNLIGNALKYQPKGAVPRLNLSCQILDADWVELSLADNGIGIDPEQCEAIFGLFTRLHTQSAYPGSGMGLALCRKIVELHGGQISAHSDGPGRGMTIRLTLRRGQETG